LSLVFKINNADESFINNVFKFFRRIINSIVTNKDNNLFDIVDCITNFDHVLFKTND